MRNRSVPYDKLTPDHIPSAAAIVANRQSWTRGKTLTRKDVEDGTNTIVIREETHKEHSRTYGSGRNTPTQIKTDAKKLGKEFELDKAALEQPLKDDGHSPQKISAAFGKLNSMNESAGVYQKVGPFGDLA